MCSWDVRSSGNNKTDTMSMSTRGDQHNMKLANISIDALPQYDEQPTLWCRGTGYALPSGGVTEHAFTLAAGGHYDFTTFFNALSIMKWKKYTKASKFSLHLETCGDADITLTYADTFTYSPEPIDGTLVTSKLRDGFTPIDIDVPDFAASDIPVPTIIGFTIDAHTDVDVRSGAWMSPVDACDIRPVELSLSTTTYKKEQFVINNVRLARERIIGSKTDDIASHFHMHVVDNGRTLDANDIESDGISLHPNVNSGGSGGGARGMIESLAQVPKATHVLLMDDDVQISPESIIRTYNVLRIVKDEWKDAFVSGGMMSMLEPDIRCEDTGFMNYDGWCQPVKPTMRMSVLHDIVENEAFEPPTYRKDCQDIRQEYAAWWYCCVPVSEIEKRGLPLPFFVRFDDVEYSLRDGKSLRGEQRRFITMNGICVWHSPFFLRYDGAVERYQVVRNAFIMKHTSDAASDSDFESMFYRSLQLELWRFNYDNASITLDGFEDFMKGPSVTFAPGFAEQKFMEAHRKAEKLRPLSEMSDELMELGIDWRILTADSVTVDVSRSMLDRGIDFLTFNGQRFITGKHYTKQGKVALMDATGSARPTGHIRKADAIVAIDLQNRKGAIRHKDVSRFRDIMERYASDINEYHARKQELDDAYHQAAAKMHTTEAWKDYLGLKS